jgi:DNA-binding FadR family transcriptional regulator
MSGATLLEVYEACAVVEPSAAGLLAARRTPQDLDDLSTAVDRVDGLLERDAVTTGALVEALQHFHDLVVERAGNRTLALQAGLMREVITAHMSTVIQRRLDGPQVRVQSHKAARSFRRLLLLVRARDTRRAEDHWRAHVLGVARTLLHDDDVRVAGVLALFP